MLYEVITERLVRESFGELNERIRRMNATQLSGPSSGLIAFDLDRLVARWRAARPD